MSKVLEADAYREGAGAACNIKPTGKIVKLLMRGSRQAVRGAISQTACMSLEA